MLGMLWLEAASHKNLLPAGLPPAREKGGKVAPARPLNHPMQGGIMSRYRVRNWHKFQHFKDRRPPWIKLYRDLLDDREWHNLDGDASKTLVMIWLIASEDDGNLPALPDLAFRLRISENKLNEILTKLTNWLEHTDIKLILLCHQSDTPETETYREEKEEETEEASPSCAKVRTYPAEFEKFWLKWPQDRRKAKPNAYKAWMKCIKRIAPDYLLTCLERYLATDKDALRGFYPMPHKWLNGEEWEGFQPPAKAEADANIADIATQPHGNELLAIFIELQKLVAPPVFRSWLAPLRIKSINSEQIIFNAPSRFVGEWIRTHYLTEIAHAAGVVCPGGEVRIEHGGAVSPRIDLTP